MDFKEKLLLVRKDRGLSQEEVAEAVGVSRQAVAKWESGLAYPDIANLVALSDLFGVSIDRLVKPESDTCAAELVKKALSQDEKLIAFLIKAKKGTYAAHAKEEAVSSRPQSHDIKYEEGGYLYLDTYLGGNEFAGEEALWNRGEPVWAMNYVGRVIAEPFEGDFLKEALLRVPQDMPYRGPMVYANGDYRYHCAASGNVNWFQGYEEIFYQDKKVYECYYHGGRIA